MGLDSPGHPAGTPRTASFLLLSFILAATLGVGSLKGQGRDGSNGKVHVMGNEPFTQVAIRSRMGRSTPWWGNTIRNSARFREGGGHNRKPSEEKPRGLKRLK